MISEVQQRLKKVDTTTDHIYCVEEVLTLANLVGFPSLTLPLGFVDRLPIGININAAALREAQLLQMGALIEAYTGLKN